MSTTYATMTGDRQPSLPKEIPKERPSNHQSTSMTSTESDDSNSAFTHGLTRKLILSQDNTEQPKRITNEAVLAAGELLRIFVQEARHRAGIEAECEQEANVDGHANDGKTLIRADHVTKVSAELLLDFS